MTDPISADNTEIQMVFCDAPEFSDDRDPGYFVLRLDNRPSERIYVNSDQEAVKNALKVSAIASSPLIRPQ